MTATATMNDAEYLINDSIIHAGLISAIPPAFNNYVRNHRHGMLIFYLIIFMCKYDDVCAQKIANKVTINIGFFYVASYMILYQTTSQSMSTSPPLPFISQLWVNDIGLNLIVGFDLCFLHYRV